MSTKHKSTFLYSGNKIYIEEMFDRYLRDPDLVSTEWQDYFKNFSTEENQQELLKERQGASWMQNDSGLIGKTISNNSPDLSLSDFLTDKQDWQELSIGALMTMMSQSSSKMLSDTNNSLDSIRAIMLIRAYRKLGHRDANLDPLQLEYFSAKELKIENFGFSETDWNKSIYINYYLGLETATLREIVDTCRKIYCGNVGIEYQHIMISDEKRWLQERIESGQLHKPLTAAEKITVFEQLVCAGTFETFLGKKFTGAKRFGLDGSESLIPMIEAILLTGSEMGLQEVNIGMAHRGRLNVLANIMGKSFATIFSEFKGVVVPNREVQVSGDVKYHLGLSSDRQIGDKIVHLSLSPNPSHLECVNTVILGKVRAKQQQISDIERTKVMGLLLHGDAAFIGQGVVAETFLLSQLKGYRTGGTVHIIINNQIGFTTTPSDSRSSPYCSDMAKSIDAPVLHVNGDDPEMCVRVAQLAITYRQKFKKDIVIDMWCYRRHGHNESDEPMFTNPRMYQVIDKHPGVLRKYFDYLIKNQSLSSIKGEYIIAQFEQKLNNDFSISDSFSSKKLDWLEGRWEGLLAKDNEHCGQTGVSNRILIEVGTQICKIPANFNVHHKIIQQLKNRQKMISTGKNIDWGMAEALAFGTLLCESTPIRLSGEDCQRGTFSHRHAVLHDQTNYSTFTPLNAIRPGQAKLEVIDSPLSEFGLLGYEYGYASAAPRTMVIWEAQFGDFANGAQVIIDQFISSSETKWLRMCGLVMLLPHGYEGQGPEHSSARLERYLQSSAEDNWQVCNITAPSNFFHALRRQILRNFRKPLIVMSPKSLLRHKLNVSKLEDFIIGTSFHHVLDDHRINTSYLTEIDNIERVVLCSGKVYFDLLEKCIEQNFNKVRLIRIEQLYPYPRDALLEILTPMKNVEFIWCQEEPKNNGAWEYIYPLLQETINILGSKKLLRYAGRERAAAPATGAMSTHKQQQYDLIESALLG